jgi:hypothetical protein
MQVLDSSFRVENTSISVDRLWYSICPLSNFFGKRNYFFTANDYFGQSSTGKPISTVRSLGSWKKSAAFWALRLINTNSARRKGESPSLFDGTNVSRPRKKVVLSGRRLRFLGASSLGDFVNRRNLHEPEVSDNPEKAVANYRYFQPRFFQPVRDPFC